MTKVAVYGFIRVVFDLLGPPSFWWSVEPMILGAASALIGVLFATIQSDLKKLLAYSTIENIGIIFIALGLALAFKANGMALPAALAFTAALLSRFQSFAVQEPAVLRRRRGIERERRKKHRAARRPHSLHAENGVSFSRRLRRHRRPAAAERLRVGMAGLPGDSAEPVAAAMDREAPRSGGRRGAGAERGARRGGYVRAYGVAFLGRPRSEAARDGARPGSLVARGHGGFADAVPSRRSAAEPPHRHDLARGDGFCRRPHADAGGTLLALDRARSPKAAAPTMGFWSSCSFSSPSIRRDGSSTSSARARSRRAPAWDCGYIETSPTTQYTAAASRSRSGAPSALSPFRCGSVSTCRRRARRGPRASASRSRIESSTISMRRSPGRVSSAPPAERAQSHDDPGISRARFRRARLPPGPGGDMTFFSTSWRRASKCFWCLRSRRCSSASFES